jgi:type II secretory pathway component GspD/PulD (secretin)
VRAAGLAYERVGNSILVADVQKLAAPTGLTTGIFDLQYAGAEEVSRVLEVITRDVSAELRTNRVVMRASPSAIDQASRIVAELDRKPGQILLEARLIEVNTTALKEVGIDWEKITNWSTVLTEGHHGPSPAGQIPDNIDYLRADESSDIYRQMAAFEVSLEAMITEGSARLLSNTKVVTLDGEPAEIFAGETVPVVITSLQTPGGAGGVFQTVQLEKIDIGVKLSIVPRITDKDYITTLVEPEISRIVAFVGPDDDLPQTSTRRARTLVRVRDGQKIYLGGLLLEEKRKTLKKVPLLGHIPLLGYFFQHTREETIHLDLVIEITPRIVGDEGGAVPVAPQIESMENNG